jgi:hypothetical protein
VNPFYHSSSYEGVKTRVTFNLGTGIIVEDTAGATMRQLELG